MIKYRAIYKKEISVLEEARGSSYAGIIYKSVKVSRFKRHES